MPMPPNAGAFDEMEFALYAPLSGSDDEDDVSPGTLRTATARSVNALLHHDAEASVFEPLPLLGHRCTECSKRFARLIDLTRHERLHTGETPFRCNKCTGETPFRFPLKSQLKIHIRLHAKPAKVEIAQFACHQCHKSFENKWSLTRHQIVHSIEKPFNCETCHKGYAHRYQLTRHRRTVHGIGSTIVTPAGSNRVLPVVEPANSGGMPLTPSAPSLNRPSSKSSFQCTECEMSFSTQSNRQRHLLNCHSPARQAAAKQAAVLRRAAV